MPTVIHVGTNEAVLSTRKTILEKGGHTVHLARDLHELIAACEQTSFDVGIVGQSLPAKEKLRVSGILRQYCPGIKILEFHNGLAPEVETADAHLRVGDSTPADLVNTVNRLARIPRPE
jgi:CheY-like chemotaxis protein